nr:MAG TPA: hypothetical protein [Caudoviricetes sp.]
MRFDVNLVRRCKGTTFRAACQINTIQTVYEDHLNIIQNPIKKHYAYLLHCPLALSRTKT